MEKIWRGLQERRENSIYAQGCRYIDKEAGAYRLRVQK